MVIWRIGNHADLSGAGGIRSSGRWHRRGAPVVKTLIGLFDNRGPLFHEDFGASPGVVAGSTAIPADSHRTRLRGLQVLRNPGEQRVEGGADLLRGLPVERHPHLEV